MTSIKVEVSENVASYIQSYPNLNTALFTSTDNTNDDNDKMVVMLNCTHRNIVNAAEEVSIKILQPIIQQRANAISIKPTHAVSDTGATSVFIMKDTKVQNKHRATKPISISLPD